MLAQCAYIYENDHRCGRIPRHGETLCRDHRNRLPPRARGDEEAFERAMDEVAESFALLPLPALLEECASAIGGLYALVQNKASAEERAAWFRASIAITGAVDRLDLESAPVDPSLPSADSLDLLFAQAKQLTAQLQQKLSQQCQTSPARISHYNGNPQACGGPPCI